MIALDAKVEPDDIKRVFQEILRTPPRRADIAVVAMAGGTVEVLAEYIWDHWLGEPDEPTLGTVTRHVQQVLEGTA